MLKGILKARRKHLISIHLSISSKCKEESLSLSVSRRRRVERTCVLVMCTCIFLFLSKTLGESYRFPSYSRGLRGLGETGFCDVQSGTAKNKISFFSLFLSLSSSILLYLCFSLFPSRSSFLSPFFLTTFFRLSLFLDFSSLRPRSASNVPERRTEDTGTQCALNRSLSDNRFR